MAVRLCQMIFRSGLPCNREASSDGDYCEICAGRSSADKGKQARLYNLAIGQARADEVAAHADVMGIRNELAVLRLLFERRYNAAAAGGEAALAVAAPALGDMLRKITDVVISGDSLERKRGCLLDKQRVTQLGEALMDCVNEVIVEFVKDEDDQGEMLAAIAARFLAILKEETK